MNKDIKEKLEKELELQGDMYFPEIERFFEDNNFDYKGNKTLRLNDNQSIICENKTLVFCDSYFKLFLIWKQI